MKLTEKQSDKVLGRRVGSPKNSVKNFEKKSDRPRPGQARSWLSLRRSQGIKMKTLKLFKMLPNNYE
jgi:hypothetical protein